MFYGKSVNIYSYIIRHVCMECYGKSVNTYSFKYNTIESTYMNLYILKNINKLKIVIC